MLRLATTITWATASKAQRVTRGPRRVRKRIRDNPPGSPHEWLPSQKCAPCFPQRSLSHRTDHLRADERWWGQKQQQHSGLRTGLQPTLIHLHISLSVLKAPCFPQHSFSHRTDHLLRADKRWWGQIQQHSRLRTGHTHSATHHLIRHKERLHTAICPPTHHHTHCLSLPHHRIFKDDRFTHNNTTTSTHNDTGR